MSGLFPLLGLVAAQLFEFDAAVAIEFLEDNEGYAALLLLN